MKWFKKEDNVKKKDDKSTYITLENGKVVPVVEEKVKKPEKEEVKRPPNPDEVEEKQMSKPMRWVWFVFVALLAYGMVQLYSQVAIETKEELNLQEIQRKTVEINKKDDVAPKNGEDVVETATKWKDQLKDSFETNDTPEKATANPDQSVLFEIRKADEEGTVLLQQVRDASVKYIQGDMSRGQYILRIQSIDLKMNRYHKTIEGIESKVNEGHRYNEHISYVKLKEQGLQSLLVELSVVQQEAVAVTFNNAVDFHNELTKEADELFVQELKQLGYTVKVQNGTISYQ